MKEIICIRCEEELKEQGAILYSPPEDYSVNEL